MYFCLVKVAVYLPYSPDLTLFGPLEKIPVMITLRQRRGAAESRAAVAVEEGEQLLLGMNTCCCSNVEEACQQRCRQH